jgi:hypothetical protein
LLASRWSDIPSVADAKIERRLAGMEIHVAMSRRAAS